jgi:hypothetical protein
MILRNFHILAVDKYDTMVSGILSPGYCRRQCQEKIQGIIEDNAKIMPGIVVDNAKIMPGIVVDNAKKRSRVLSKIMPSPGIVVDNAKPGYCRR